MMYLVLNNLLLRTVRNGVHSAALKAERSEESRRGGSIVKELLPRRWMSRPPHAVIAASRAGPKLRHYQTHTVPGHDN